MNFTKEINKEVLKLLKTSEAGKITEFEPFFIYFPEKKYTYDGYGKKIDTNYLCSYCYSLRKYNDNKTISLSLITLTKDYKGKHINPDKESENFDSVVLDNLAIATFKTSRNWKDFEGI